MDTVDGWEAVGNGESSVGREQGASFDITEGWETVGNSLGRAPLGGSDILRSRAVGTSFQDKFHQCDCPAKLCAEDFSSANVGRWDTHSFVTGSDTKNAQLLARFFSRTNFINTIVAKIVRPRPAKVSKPWAMEHA